MRDRSFGKRSAARKGSRGCHRQNEKRFYIAWGGLVLSAKILWPDKAKALDALLTQIHSEKYRVYSEERYLKRASHPTA